MSDGFKELSQAWKKLVLAQHQRVSPGWAAHLAGLSLPICAMGFMQTTTEEGLLVGDLQAAGRGSAFGDA